MLTLYKTIMDLCYVGTTLMIKTVTTQAVLFI